MIRLLTPNELDLIKKSINRDQHFLYYSYLTVRKQNTVHVGHFSDQNELLGILASFKGLPFLAFSFLPLQSAFCLQSTLKFMGSQLNFPKHGMGSIIVNEADLDMFTSQITPIETPRKILLMKHVDQEALPKHTPLNVTPFGPAHHNLIESKMTEMNTLAFTKDELDYPFCGIMEENQLVAVGGFHIYCEDYAELGNIVTDISYRKRGYGRSISTELTRVGKLMTPNVYLNVIDNNDVAVRLYQSIGYQIIRSQYMINFDMGKN
ncbi:GNAT family N-acetyltransferase [Paenibacillus sp. XY044]|uniref:GNAT family N-acetyltransferase n=1 Tax=Paenibacillus sp. XY044 TaxID=2026089 RepID=UPI000B996EAD|nr:GNAT family N-acetyltransferase [Paenibacillus sp. XY044]OZB92369.1 GNAT family N-acetyltransferase [Paenibacillus sp. XY044]